MANPVPLMWILTYSLRLEVVIALTFIYFAHCETRIRWQDSIASSGAVDFVPKNKVVAPHHNMHPSVSISKPGATP